MECFVVKVQDPHGLITKDILLYPGIPRIEVQQALTAAFSLQVTGLVNPLLDIYFPTPLISKTPEYFSTRVPYRVVPETGGGERWRNGKDAKIYGRSSTTVSEETLGVMSKGFCCTGTRTVDQRRSSDAAIPKSHSAKMGPRLGVFIKSTGEALGTLCPEAGKEGNLSRFASFVPDEPERSCNKPDGDGTHLLRGLGNHDMRAVVELLSMFTDQDGCISSPAFVGCIQALCEVDGHNLPTGAEMAKLKTSSRRLFDMLDDHQLGTVPLTVLASAIGALCGKRNDGKSRALFDMYANGDGCIAEKDVRKILVATFKVLLEVDPVTCAPRGKSKREGSVNPESVAEKTAARAFEEATLNPDGTMSFKEFHQWYMRVVGIPSPSVSVGKTPSRTTSSGVALPAALDVGEVHRTFKLGDVNASRFIRGLRATARHGRVSWVSFLRYMYGFSNARPLTEESHAAVLMAKKLFDIYDDDRRREVDLRELASGLAILCKGSWKDRAVELFSLLDTKRQGYLSRGAMDLYLSSSFKFLRNLQPGVSTATDLSALNVKGAMASFETKPGDGIHDPERFDQRMFADVCFNMHNEEGCHALRESDEQLAEPPISVGTTHEELSNLTAASIMEEMGDNDDSRFSPSSGWSLSDESIPNGLRRPRAPEFHCNSSGFKVVGKGDTGPGGSVWQHDWKSCGASLRYPLDGQGDVVVSARELLCLDCFSVNDLLEILAEASVMGTLTLDDFWRCISYVLQLGGTREGTCKWDEAFLLTECIHRAFEDADGVVAFASMACGISILCQSTIEDKVLAAFLLLDTDGDGQLVFEEVMIYITSVLRVVCAIGQDMTVTIHPDELGAALATQCFRQAKLTFDAKMGIDDFRLFTR